MDDPLTLMCAICFDSINPQQGFVYGRTIQFVNGKNVCAHHICLCIRKCMPRRRMSNIPACPNNMGVSWKQVQDMFKETPVCAVCSDDVTEMTPVAIFPACKHKCIHTRCLDIITDTTRRWTCPICPLNPNNDELSLTKWRQPRAGKFSQMFIDDEQDPEPSTEIQEMCDSTSIIQAIEKNLPAVAIKRSFEKRKQNEKTTVKIDSVTKWIVHAIQLDSEKDKNTDMSLLEKLHRCNYTASDLLTFGFTFEMLVSDAGNHGLLLDRTFATTGIISRAPLLADFTKMLLAGIDIGLISAAGYTEADLNHLHFTMRGFLAAGGTNQELRVLRAKIKDTTMCNIFSLTAFMEECLQTTSDDTSTTE